MWDRAAVTAPASVGAGASLWIRVNCVSFMVRLISSLGAIFFRRCVAHLLFTCVNAARSLLTNFGRLSHRCFSSGPSGGKTCALFLAPNTRELRLTNIALLRGCKCDSRIYYTEVGSLRAVVSRSKCNFPGALRFWNLCGLPEITIP